MLGSDKKREPYYGYILQTKPKFVWIIDKFSERCKTFGEYILSPEFTYGSEMKISWKLAVFPYGFNEENNSYLSIYLISQNYTNIYSSFGLGIENISDPNNFSKIEFTFGKIRSGGFDNFLERNKVIEKIKDVDDELHISCEIYSINLLDNSLFEIKNPKLSALNRFGELYMNKTLCDTTIKVAGKEFKVHKAILAARSKMFADMFEHNMIKKGTSTIEINDISRKAFEALMRFIYTGELIKNNKIIKELLLAADKYKVTDLKDTCFLKLYYSLNPHNAVDLLMYSELHNLYKLKANIMDYIIMQYKDVVNDPSFKLLKEVPQLLTELERARAEKKMEKTEDS